MTAQVEPTEQERLERLREVLRSTGAASESRFRKGLRQGREQGVLVGAALHAADRARLGRTPTDLEQLLLKVLRGVMSEAEVGSFGQEYRASIAELGWLEIVPKAITSRSVESGFTLADVRGRLPVMAAETVTLANAAIVDPATLAAGKLIETERFSEGVREFGFGATVFRVPPRSPRERGKPVPEFRARLELEKFTVQREVGDQWGGKDEIYWMVGASSDKAKRRPFQSEEFGAVRRGDEREFDSNRKVIFDNPAGTHVGLSISSWEADQSSAAWYEKLFEILQEVVDQLWLVDLVNNFTPDPSGALIAAGLEIAKLFIFLKEVIRNNDDLSAQRTIFLDRNTLVSLFHRKDIEWGFNGEGYHTLHARYTGERPAFPTGTLEYVTLAADGNSWSAPVSLGWESSTPGVMRAHEGKLHVMYVQPGDYALMWSTLDSQGLWSIPTPVRDFKSYHRPAMTVYKGKLFIAFTDLAGAVRVSALTDTQWSNAYHPHSRVISDQGPCLAVTGLGILGLGFRDIRSNGGRLLSIATAGSGLEGWNTPGEIRGYAPENGVSATSFLGVLWYAYRHNGAINVHRSDGDVPPSPAWAPKGEPTLATHNLKVYLMARGSEGQLHCLKHHDGSWTPVPDAIPSGAMESQSDPGLASHKNTLYAMYRR